MLNIALFGPPGAGKGTQAKFLIEKYELVYISTGDLLRNEMANNTEIGKFVKKTISEGGLVDDEIIVQIIEKTISENSKAKGFLFDGFPRTYVQAYILEGLMLKLNTKLDRLISINVNIEESVRRMLERAKSETRTDDAEDIIRHRLEEYEDKTMPVLNYYKEKGLLDTIDGHLPIDKVRAQIISIIDEILSTRLFNIVLYGYPGAGKSSQGKLVAKKYGLTFISTGELLAEEIKNNTKIGKYVKKFYENGILVPDEIVIQLLETALVKKNNTKGYIFKGYPRTRVQSYILDGLLKKIDSSISKVIEIKVPTLELIRRLNKRSKSENCMPYDSSTEKIINRLEEHEKKTLPVIEKYKQIHGVTTIDGLGTFDEIFELISKTMDDK